MEGHSLLDFFLPSHKGFLLRCFPFHEPHSTFFPPCFSHLIHPILLAITLHLSFSLTRLWASCCQGSNQLKPSFQVRNLGWLPYAKGEVNHHIGHLKPLRVWVQLTLLISPYLTLFQSRTLFLIPLHSSHLTSRIPFFRYTTLWAHLALSHSLLLGKPCPLLRIYTFLYSPDCWDLSGGPYLLFKVYFKFYSFKEICRESDPLIQN